MTDRDDFTGDEWRTLARTPGAVMYAVVVTSFGGLRRERKTIRRTLRHADDFPAETDLVRHLAGFVAANASRLARDAGREDLDRGLTRARANDHCRQSVSILRATATPAEREEFGRFVLYCAGNTAFAGRELGVLGLGQTLSPAEREFLGSLEETLGVDSSPDGPDGSRWLSRLRKMP